MKLALGMIMLALAHGEGDPRPETFERCFQQIRPRPGESPWADVPWLTDLHEARRKAAAEGKPIFVQAGGKSVSIGAC
ncbi:MAG TPA: hypothetical protein VF950_30120 [Planctomycetota bacterium]